MISLSVVRFFFNHVNNDCIIYSILIYSIENFTFYSTINCKGNQQIDKLKPHILINSGFYK